MIDLDTRLGGTLLAVGSAAVVLITALYASMPLAVSAPLPATTSVAEALASIGPVADRLVLAGRIGLSGDFLLIFGASLLALQTSVPVLKRLLFVALAISTAMFLVVDGLAGFVLAALAAEQSPAFSLARRLYDLAFYAGTVAFGLGAIAGVLAAATPAWLRGLWAVVAVLGLGSYLLALFGIVLPLGFGAAVGLAGLGGGLAGWREARS